MLFRRTAKTVAVLLAAVMALAIAPLAGHRILCGHREGPFGVTHWGRSVRSWLATQLDGYGFDHRAYPGQPLLIQRNGDLFSNGDTAVVIAGGDGSLSAAAMGYAQDLARERCGGLLLPVFETLPMKIGTREEPAARFAYELQTGQIVMQCGFFASRPYGVSPDGLVGDDGLIEIKTMCSSATLFRAVVDGDVSEYMDQIVGEMWLLGRQWCDLCLWAPDLGADGALIVRRIERDEAQIERLASDLGAFAATIDKLASALAGALAAKE